ncbi:raffinose/stachyose/melibiose transport system substrate-binding protein [Rathayibacter sp. PhB151]|jgi:raffinose/stachyose/melibiose transport system substrate-binding protein|uniref:ABC transporter substrate-binding protein n=1 Tax=Rathayibacter sp. PhB151 TaxID=2485189 RepID=UPI001063EBBA|nr:extracellular solute-binding protein [Rathayibacter sp. PhB151]TDX77405.1 raffinose/stachyose/melibiose transport system substrate-binding protein [Rathayibacter sp. PhB151]
MTPRHVPPPGALSRRLFLSAAASAASIAALASCASPGAANGVTTLDFFQFKAEAVEDFARIIAQFEAANPDIRVIANNVPDPDTALRTLLVKDKIPDVLTLNGSGYYADLAKAGVFHDFTGDELVERVNPAALEIIDALGSFNGEEINALAFANNADGILYNRTIFADNGIEVPTTWDELIAVCDTLVAAGITPFYGALLDNWTGAPAFNALGGQLQPEGFFDAMRAEGADLGPDSPVSFSKDYALAMERLGQLFSYTQEGSFGRGYDDGNQAFAAGEAAMYPQGIWAINPVRTNNPDIDLGVFPYPVLDDPADTKVTSGVDVAVAIGRGTAKLEAARRFVAFLLDPAVVEPYVESQAAFSPLVGAAPNSDPTLAELQPYFEQGRLIGFVDHQIPASIPLNPTLQAFLASGDADAALRTLDSEWRKVAARTTRK